MAFKDSNIFTYFKSYFRKYYRYCITCKTDRPGDGAANRAGTVPAQETPTDTYRHRPAQILT